MKDFFLAMGTILAIFSAFLIAGFVSAVFCLTLRLLRKFSKLYLGKSPSKVELSGEEKAIGKFMASKNVFVRDPAQYKDVNNDGVDDLETR